MWLLWRMSRSLEVRPSELVGYPTGSVGAFYFDRGLWAYCTKIEADMDQASNNAKDHKSAHASRQRVLDSYIAPGETHGRFRDPANLWGKKPKPEEENFDLVVGGDRFNA